MQERCPLGLAVAQVAPQVMAESSAGSSAAEASEPPAGVAARRAAASAGTASLSIGLS